MKHQPTSQSVEQAIANDARTNELGIQVEVTTDDAVTVRGEVASTDRRDAVLAVVQERMPDAEIIDRLELSDATAPPHDTEIVEPD